MKKKLEYNSLNYLESFYNKGFNVYVKIGGSYEKINDVEFIEKFWILNLDFYTDGF